MSQKFESASITNQGNSNYQVFTVKKCKTIHGWTQRCCLRGGALKAEGLNRGERGVGGWESMVGGLNYTLIGGGPRDLPRIFF